MQPLFDPTTSQFHFIVLGMAHEQEFPSHSQLLASLEACARGEEMAWIYYMYFLGAYVSSTDILREDREKLYTVLKATLENSEVYISLTLVHTRPRRKSSTSATLVDQKHVERAEQDVMKLIRLCEPIDQQQAQELLQISEGSKLEQVQINLLEYNEDYVSGLRILLKLYAEGKTYLAERLFVWIDAKLAMLDEKVKANPDNRTIKGLFD